MSSIRAPRLGRFLVDIRCIIYLVRCTYTFLLPVFSYLFLTLPNKITAWQNSHSHDPPITWTPEPHPFPVAHHATLLSPNSRPNLVICRSCAPQPGFGLVSRLLSEAVTASWPPRYAVVEQWLASSSRVGGTMTTFVAPQEVRRSSSVVCEARSFRFWPRPSKTDVVNSNGQLTRPVAWR
ncbi:hypothetical protein B0H66DRAFT_163553 [Apodospora peruviana]|uniref:Uncharacterized protein n=1 Tax=Apodospora peruviana TaxID=516989 RepID=A0AAE0MBP0_9PEZI|nr:hypothetical protein B0H66DRAFT_163553 [Apodospora peruviana]